MGHIAGPKTNQEIEEGHSGQPHRSPVFVGPHLGPGGHDMHKVPVVGDYCGDKEDEAQLQLHRKHQVQLFLGGILIADTVAFGITHCWLVSIGQ